MIDIDSINSESSLYFNVVTALSFLILKILLTALIRGLSDDKGIKVLDEGFSGFGIDMCLFGTSLLIAAIASDNIQLAGLYTSILVVLIFLSVVFSTMLYGYCHKPSYACKRWLLISGSWFFGAVPFTIGLTSFAIK